MVDALGQEKHFGQWVRRGRPFLPVVATDGVRRGRAQPPLVDGGGTKRLVKVLQRL